MLLEINFAATHIIQWLKNSDIFSASDEICEKFLMAISAILKEKFHGHWNPNYPNNGSAYRAITCFKGNIDEVLIITASVIGISENDLISALPAEFVIWIDPMDVSYRIGEHNGYPKSIWNQKHSIAFVPKKSSPLRISKPISETNGKNESLDGSFEGNEMLFALAPRQQNIGNVQ